MISLIDRCMAQILDAMTRLGLLENTLLVATSDHGEQLGHRHLYSKCYGYEPSLRVPLLMHAPGTVPAGLERDDLIEHIDLIPTVCDALGLPAMGTSGRSFWDRCRGEAPAGHPHRDFTYCSYSDGQIFRDCEAKWIHRKAGESRFADEVYDLKDDPREQTNIAATEQGRAVIARFLPRLQELSMDGLRNDISVTHPAHTQPPLIPFFTT